MHQKINITLPEQTIHLIEQITSKEGRSQFIEEAVIYYIGKFKLREQLKQGAINRSERDLKLSTEWNLLEEKIW